MFNLKVAINVPMIFIFEPLNDTLFVNIQEIEDNTYSIDGKIFHGDNSTPTILPSFILSLDQVSNYILTYISQILKIEQDCLSDYTVTYAYDENKHIVISDIKLKTIN